MPITKLNREAVAELQAEPARGRPLQELLRPGPGLLALRAVAGADARAGSARSSPRTRPCWRPTRRTLKAGYNYGETDRGAAGPLPRRQGRASSRARYRKITGNEALAIGLVAAAAAGQHAAGLRQLSDHAGQRHPAPPGRAEALRRPHHPGRGRDRRHRHGHRRLLRRRAGRDGHQRPGHLPQVRGASAWP